MKFDIWKVTLFFSTILLMAYRIYPSHMEMGLLLEQSALNEFALQEYNMAITKTDDDEAKFRVASLNEQLGNVGPTRELYEQVARKNPLNHRAHENLIRIYQWNRQPARVLQEYERYKNELSQKVMITDTESASLQETLVNLRNIYSAQGGKGWLKVIELTKTLMQLDPDNPDYYIDLIDLYLRTRQPTKATDIALSAEQKFKHNTELLEKIAWCSLCTGNLQHSISTYAKLVKRDNTTMEYWYNILSVMGRIQNPSVALEYYHLFVELATDHITILLQYAVILEQYKLFEEALGIYHMLYAKQPTDKSVLNGLLVCYEELSEYDRALIIAHQYESIYGIDDTLIDRVMNMYITQEHYDKALKVIDRYMEKAPNNLKLLTTRAELLEWASKPLQAAQAYEKILTLQNNDEIREKIVRLYMWSENYEHARTHGESLLTQHPDNSSYKELMCDIYRALQMPDQLMPLLEQIITDNPQDTEHKLEFASLLIEAQEFDRAYPLMQELYSVFPHNEQVIEQLAWLYEMNGKFDHAAQLYEELLLQRPDDRKLTKTIARIYLDVKRYDDTLRIIESIADSSDTELLQWQIDALLAKNEYTEALKLIDTLLSTEMHHELLKIKGSILIERKEYYHALPIYTLLYDRDPNDQDILLTLTNLYVETADYHAAQSVIEQYLNISKEDAKAWETKAFIAEQLNDTTSMKQALRQALYCLNKSYDGNEYVITRANILKRLGNIPAALIYYRTAIPNEPDNATLRYEYIDCLIQAQMYEDVIDEIKGMSFSMQESAQIQAALSQALIQTKDYDTAEQVINQLLSQTPDDPNLKADLAFVFYNKGRWDKSLKLYQDILRAQDKRWERYEEIQNEAKTLLKEYAPQLQTGVLLIQEKKRNTQFYYSNAQCYLRHDVRMQAGFGRYRFRDSSNPYFPEVDDYLEEFSIESEWLVHKFLSIDIGPVMINHGPEDIYTTSVGFTFDNHKDMRFKASYNRHDKLLSPRQAVPYGGRTTHFDTYFSWQLHDALLLHAEAIHSSYVFADSVRRLGLSTKPGTSDQLSIGTDLIILFDPRLALTYRYYWMDSKMDRDYGPLLFSLDSKVRAHHIGLQIEGQINNFVTYYGTVFVGNDDERDLYLDALNLYGYEIGLRYAVTENIELGGSYQFLYENPKNGQSSRIHYLNAYGRVAF